MQKHAVAIGNPFTFLIHTDTIAGVRSTKWSVFAQLLPSKKVQVCGSAAAMLRADSFVSLRRALPKSSRHFSYKKQQNNVCHSSPQQQTCSCVMCVCYRP